METTTVSQVIPALSSSVKTAAIEPMPYVANLEIALQEREDLIIDFTSLKTCLDPTSACDTQQQTQPVSWITCTQILDYSSCILTMIVQFTFSAQFDYESYVFELLDKQPEKLSSLQSLSVRKLTPPSDSSTDDESDRCKWVFRHAVIKAQVIRELTLPLHSLFCDRFKILLWINATFNTYWTRSEWQHYSSWDANSSECKTWYFLLKIGSCPTSPSIQQCQCICTCSCGICRTWRSSCWITHPWRPFLHLLDVYESWRFSLSARMSSIHSLSHLGFVRTWEYSTSNATDFVIFQQWC